MSNETAESVVLQRVKTVEFHPSAYTENPRTIAGYYPAAERCPCGETPASDQECIECEAFCCPRCERWCAWECGCADDAPALCDECTVRLRLFGNEVMP